MALNVEVRSCKRDLRLRLISGEGLLMAGGETCGGGASSGLDAEDSMMPSSWVSGGRILF